MSSQMNTINQGAIDGIHQYYMEIINSIPDIIYWIDRDCNLQGCNKNFIKLLGLNTLEELRGTPYQQMDKYAHWNKDRIEEFKLDDMNVLFSGVPQHNVNEKLIKNEQGKSFYFRSQRVPMYNSNKEITGLVVVLNDITLNKEIEVHTEGLSENQEQKLNNYSPSVLVVEDNIIAQNVEKALLSALHCQVDIADSAETAVHLFSPGKYDLVLMDIGLEDSSGYLAAKRLRQKEKDTQHHVPIIALTGYEADVIKYDCKHYSMEGAISKPLTCEQAEQLIKHYIYHMDVPVPGLKTI